MKAGLVGLCVCIVLAGAGIWYISGKPSDTAKAEAQKQAAAFVQDLYANAGTPAPAAPAQTAAAAVPTQPVTNVTNNKKIMNATLHTNQGDITIEFSNDTPNTVANFTKLAQEGFYDGTKFHRVIKGFMIQGGDPLSKDDSMASRWGTGGPGYAFNDEIGAGNHNNAGTIAMANSGPNTNGSQFFVNVANNNFLDTKHTVFGKVIAGMDVVAKIENTATGASDRPVEAMVINSITLQ